MKYVNKRVQTEEEEAARAFHFFLVLDKMVAKILWWNMLKTKQNRKWRRVGRMKQKKENHTKK